MESRLADVAPALEGGFLTTGPAERSPSAPVISCGESASLPRVLGEQAEASCIFMG